MNFFHFTVNILPLFFFTYVCCVTMNEPNSRGRSTAIWKLVKEKKKFTNKFANIALIDLVVYRFPLRIFRVILKNILAKGGILSYFLCVGLLRSCIFPSSTENVWCW